MEFTKNSSLIRHFRKHTGENPFECKVCRKSFSRKDNFSKHKQSKYCIARTQNSGVIIMYKNYSNGSLSEIKSSSAKNL
jgi:uncharacterized Zn-finger protein